MRRRSRQIPDPHPALALAGLPLAPRRPRAGVPAAGQSRPSKHEIAILRRLAQPGGFVLVTFREGKEPLYLYGDSGEVIRDTGSWPLSVSGFSRLRQWLEPIDSEDLFGLSPQRYVVRKP